MSRIRGFGLPREVGVLFPLKRIRSVLLPWSVLQRLTLRERVEASVTEARVNLEALLVAGKPVFSAEVIILRRENEVEQVSPQALPLQGFVEQ